MKENAISEIQELFELLRMEREEDIKQYKEIIEQTPLEVRRKKGLSWYPVLLDSAEIGLGGQQVFILTRTKDLGKHHKFRVGQSASLFLHTKDKPTVTGIVAKVKDDTIKLMVSGEAEVDWLYDGKLGLDLLYNEATYKEMDRALRKLIDAKKNSRLAELRDVILGYKEAVSHKFLMNVSFDHLNEIQSEAVTKIMLAEDLSIIHGPPGTGKTTTMVQAIQSCLKDGRQIMACAPSNQAVDLLTLKLIEKGVKVLRYGHPARINEHLTDVTLDYKIQNHHNYKQLKQLRVETQKLRTKAHKFKRVFGPEQRQERKELKNEVRNMIRDAKFLEKYILIDVLDKAQVVTATMVGAGNVIFRDKLFDVVFIDEAGQALEPATWIPITRAKKVVLAGDHCQLPPTIKSRKAQELGLMDTLFEKAIRRTETDTMLQVQYRMHEDIMTFSSEQFYEGMLQAHSSVKDSTLLENGDPLISQAVEFIDTAGCGYEEAINQQTLSTGNPQEAILLFNHLKTLLEQLSYHQTPEINQALSIGVIAPYRAQVNLLRKELNNVPELKDWKDQITIATVDGFQGQERDIIYISLTTSNQDGHIGFLSDTRRMNVALTRAKKKLVVVGDSATISNHKFYQSFLNYVETIEAYKSAWEFMY